jgi:hypothetical protein
MTRPKVITLSMAYCNSFIVVSWLMKSVMTTPNVITLSGVICVFIYCYQLVNVISHERAQQNHIKGRQLYFIIFRFSSAAKGWSDTCSKSTMDWLKKSFPCLARTCLRCLTCQTCLTCLTCPTDMVTETGDMLMIRSFIDLMICSTFSCSEIIYLTCLTCLTYRTRRTRLTCLTCRT